jgi:hypothetical protein
MLCYKIESKPKTDEEIKNSGYSKRNLYVNHKNNMILRSNILIKKANTLRNKHFQISFIWKNMESGERI